MCSITTNEVSNEMLCYPLSILVKKKSENKFKKILNDDENKKIRKLSGGFVLNKF